VLGLKIDLHVHTEFSDGHGTVEKILETAAQKGLDGLAITDHDTLDGYYKAKECGSGLLVLPGFEVKTDAGHVLVLGLEQLPYYHYRYEGLVEWARRFGGLSVLAHPAADRLHLDRWMRCKPDFVEVFNASYPFSFFFLKRGLGVAKKLGLPGVGGSDAHYSQAVGNAYTTFEFDDPDVEKVLAALKAGKASYAGKISPLSIRFRIGLGYAISRVLGV
jgi:predicted metal-dependent phosphoesterase TrpH